MIYLLDASVLLPLCLDEHEFHVRVQSWAREVENFALCAITEGALVRTTVRLGIPSSQAQNLLAALQEDPRCQFWSDMASYMHANLTCVVGHRQVTDAYLVSLTRSHAGARLATLDKGLAATYPDVAELIHAGDS